ncbi:trypsin-like serine protease [Linderina pennispora]|uniref:Trypsin-like serine protease n=1 Tax=Linderina pennispora TaxID=61395 RepID=A0A1Y1WKS2_9FUNG|nr:trypsin-like serine protease [Linderina pennispora]ORX74092.1 trypsin-like serine protease [Linderina pennispora]
MFARISIFLVFFWPSLCSPVIRVTNGTAVDQGQAPFFVRIIALSERSAELCGGTIIDQTTVITAAHCVMPPRDPILHQASAIEIYYGNVNTKQQSLTHATAVYVHPDYNTFTLENDIAVLKTNPFEYAADAVQPAPIYNGECLATISDGNIWLGSQSHWRVGARPRTVSVDKQAIDARYSSANGPTICANNNYNKGVDVCSGDSGQGTVIRRHGTAYIAGLVSYGTDANGRLTCGEPGSFGIYTHIWRYVSWITTIANTTYTAGPLPSVLVAPPAAPTPTRCILGYCF